MRVCFLPQKLAAIVFIQSRRIKLTTKISSLMLAEMLTFEPSCELPTQIFANLSFWRIPVRFVRRECRCQFCAKKLSFSKTFFNAFRFKLAHTLASLLNAIIIVLKKHFEKMKSSFFKAAFKNWQLSICDPTALFANLRKKAKRLLLYIYAYLSRAF